MVTIPDSWIPSAQVRRIICHWTAGSYNASSVDKEHYHLLIEGNGNLVCGDFSTADNESTGDDVDAAHTARLNTGSIGISVRCLSGAVERPFDPGQFPMLEQQWTVMAELAAILCWRTGIAVIPMARIDDRFGFGAPKQGGPRTGPCFGPLV